MRRTEIDLNVDFGESVGVFPSDSELAILGAASSINLSCGLHAGSPALLTNILRVAASLPVVVGAHPSYDDKANFGRIETGLPADKIEGLVATQFDRLYALARLAGVSIRYIKAHGALYHRTAHDPAAAAALCNAALRATGGPLPLLGPAGACLESASHDAGLRYFREGFLDRGYLPDASLAPRGTPGAMIHDPGKAAARAVAIASGQAIEATDGSPITVAADSLCVHGDSSTALSILQAARTALEGSGFSVVPFAR